jgi:hypothetical protein
MSLLEGVHAWFTSWLQKLTVLGALKSGICCWEVHEMRIENYHFWMLLYH